jgi:hypothetical protein
VRDKCNFKLRGRIAGQKSDIQKILAFFFAVSKLFATFFLYAINDFCFLATYDNITRYSEYLYGNSAPLEHMMLFPEILREM